MGKGMNFNQQSRKINSIKASAMAVVQQIVQIVGSFVYRTFFLMILNESYLGINGLFSNVLCLFSLAELGIGSAIQYSMYQPIMDGDIEKIGRLVHFNRKIYTILALLVLLMGGAFYPFLEQIIQVDQIPADVDLTLVYFLFVGQSATSYLYVYKQSLLSTDQRNHLISLYTCVTQLVGYVVKIAVLILTRNFVAVLISDITVNVILNYLFSLWITVQYQPVFLNRGALSHEDKVKIFKHTSGLFCHKIGMIVVTGTDNIILSKFVSLAAVGVYSNYAMIVSSISTILTRIVGGILPSVTHYVFQKTKEEVESLLHYMLFANLWLSSFTTICLFLLLNPFIELWLGSRYLFPQATVAWICMTYYFQTARLTGNNFVNGCGLFHLDRFRPLVESGINLVLSVFLAHRIGITGIFVGTVVSSTLTYFWREPYLLYKHYFSKETTRYWLMQFMWAAVSLAICGVLLTVLNKMPNGLIWFVLRMVIVVIIPNLIFVAIFYRSREMKYWMAIAKPLLRKLLKYGT